MTDTRRRTRTWMRRLYVPLMTVILVGSVGTYWAQGGSFDPNTAAQNPRIRFQTAADAAAAPGLTTREAVAASAVVDPNRPVEPHRLQLLYLGNSQTLAIMDWEPGQLTTPQLLQLALLRNEVPVDIRLGSLPNMTPTEYLIRTVSSGEAQPRQVDILLLMTVLEEFRDLSVRAEIQQEAEDPAVQTALRNLVADNPDLPLAAQALAPVLGSETSSGGGQSDVVAGGDSTAASIESWIQARAEALPVFSHRDSIRGQVYETFYEWRNSLLGLRSDSSRPVPQYEYEASLQLLEMILRYTEDQHIVSLIYLTPLRPISPNPNVPADVVRYRADVYRLCEKYGLSCFDYTDLVPGTMWTNYPDQPDSRDFAHFTGPAHRLVADQLWRDVGPLIEQIARRGAP